MPSRQGSVTKAQDLSRAPRGGGKREAVLSDFPDSCGGSREMFPSQAPARQPLWAHHLPTAFCLGVLLCLDKLPSQTVQQCFYTPQGSCSVMKTKHSTLRKKAGGRGGTGVSGEQASHTHGFPSGLRPKDGSLAAQVGALSHVIRTMTGSKRGLKTPRDE